MKFEIKLLNKALHRDPECIAAILKKFFLKIGHAKSILDFEISQNFVDDFEENIDFLVSKPKVLFKFQAGDLVSKDTLRSYGVTVELAELFGCKVGFIVENRKQKYICIKEMNLPMKTFSLS